MPEYIDSPSLIGYKLASNFGHTNNFELWEAGVSSSIRDRVVDIVCEQMGASKEKVTEATSFINDLGADSLDTVELVMEFEDEFDLNIPDEDAEKIQTVGDAVKYIEEHT